MKSECSVKQVQTRFSLLLACVLLSACVSSPSLRVQSDPEGADVTIISGSGVPLKVGKTPLEIKRTDNLELFNDTAQVQVSKEGYSPQLALIPKLGLLGATGRLSFNLAETALPKVCSQQEESFNDIARGVAEVANLTQKKRFAEAGSTVLALTAKYPSVSVLYDLQGNVFYLQKDLQRALEAYRRSNSIAPNNLQTSRMIERIQQLQGLTGGGR